MSKPHINVTPLIDVLLVLLIIFMVVTPMKPSVFQARVPSEPKTDDIVEPAPDTIVVILGRDLSLKLNHELLDATVNDPLNLSERLSGIFAEREKNHAYIAPAPDDPTPRVQRTVFIKAPRTVFYGDVAKVVDAVKAGGASPISLQIDDLE